MKNKTEIKKTGRRKKAPGELKKRVPLWIEQKYITARGGLAKASEIAYNAVVNHKPEDQ